MSRYCWERGEITLPTAAVAPLKKALRDAANTHHAAVLATCKEFWQLVAKKTRSPKKYEEALNGWRNVLYHGGRTATQVEEDAAEVLDTIVQPDWTGWKGGATRPEKQTPRQATAADVDRAAPRYTNRSDVFHLGDGASITFQGRTVIWAVPENNHADEHARAHPLAKILFDHLNHRVTWTRGSGGQIVGNDEYNRESRNDGGGSNYVIATYPRPKPTVTPQFRARLYI